MSKPLRILIVEDSQDDVTFLKRSLQKAGYEVISAVVETPGEMRIQLENQDWDVITSDHSMPKFSAPAALALAKQLRPEIPFIIVSGEIDLNLAVSLMRGGAKDYIQKRELALLVPTIERELREAELHRDRLQVQKALREREEHYRHLFQSMDSGFALHEIICDDQGVPCDYRFLEINPAFERLTGLKADELIGHTNMEILPGTENEWIERYGKVALTGVSTHFENYSRELGKYYEVTAYSPQYGQFAVIFHDITDRKKTEQALSESRALLQAAMDNSPVGIAIADAPDGKLRYVNDAGLLIRGGDRTSIVNGVGIDQYVSSWQLLDLGGRPLAPEEVPLARAILYGETNNREFIVRRNNDDDRIVIGNAAPIFDEAGNVMSAIVVFTDITENKHSEVALKESEEKFKFIFDHSIVGKSITLPSGEISVNDAFCEMLGYSADELRKKNWKDITHPDDIDLAQRMTDLLLSGEQEALRFTKRYLSKQGDVIWADVYTSLRRDAKGNPLYFITTLIDISDRKQAEETLRASQERALNSEARLKKAQAIAHVGDWFWNIKEGQIEWSDEMYRIFGIDKHTYSGRLGDVIAKVIHPDDLHIVQPSNASTFAQQKEVEYRIIWPDGSIRYINATPGEVTVGKDGTPVTLTGTCQDISERKRVEQEIKESEERYRAVVEWISEAILIHRDGIILFANPAAIELFGARSVDDLIDSPILSRVHPDFHQLALARAAEITEQGISAPILEERLLKLDGTVITAEVQTTLIVYDHKPSFHTSIRNITDRKLAEQAQRESEDKFRQMVERSSDVFYRQSILTSYFEYISPKIFDMLGYTPEEFLMMDFETQKTKIHPEDLPYLLGFSQELIKVDGQGHGHLEREFRLKNKEGIYHWIHGNYSLVRDDNGSPFLIVGSLTDISERKQVEQALHESEEKFRLIVENQQDLLVKTDSEGHLLFVNPAYCDLFGKSEKELLGSSYTPLVYPDDLPTVEKAVELLFKPPYVCNYEERASTRHGWRWLSWVAKAILDKNDKVIALIGSGRDITEQKQAEEALKKSNERLALAQRAAGVGVWDWDMLTGKLDWSSELYRLFGLDHSKAEASFDVWTSVLHPDDVQRAGERINAAIREHIPLFNEYRIVLPSGETRWIHALGDTNYNERDEATRMIGICIDITDRKLAAEQIVQLNTELEKRVADRTAQLISTNQELEAFSYSVSHDLRAPLRSLEGFSAILLEDYAVHLDEQGKNYLIRIQDASKRMSQLINDLLKLSRVTTMANFSREPVDLSRMASAIALELQAQSPHRQVTFRIAPDMIVLGDENLLKIAIVNMLNNAYKFTSRCEKAIIEVGVEEQGGIKVYFVRDNGVGFNMDFANKLFNAFQRLHSEKDFPGTGIGLATVQRIIRRHGGHIWAKGEVGQGATFYFTIG